uniref:Sorting nexin-2 n=1 Tax=Anabas testudineus TaxID=64144 RepID=A0A7N6FFG8_ANATE
TLLEALCSFSSSVEYVESSGPASLPAEDISTNSNGPKQDSLFDDDPEDLFAEATEEVSLDSPERDVLLSDGPSPAITPITPPTSVITPHIGDGMNAYMAYKVTTKTTMSLFKRSEFIVKRRFSDFLGLHSKLASKYLHIGYIVPPAPEKSIVGMTKVKVGKEDQSSNEFVEKRRSALERYLMRTVKHPVLLKDPDVLQFLESSDLPRAVSTQALSSAGLLRMVNKAADAVNKMTIKMNESDAWFEEKQQHFENLDVQLRKLHASVESLVCHRKELSVNTAQFAKSAAMLGNSEDHTALSRALSQLAEVEEKIDQLHQDQANADFYLFSELLGDYVRLITAVKGVFDHRMKTWQKWQDAQMLLQKKREAEAKLQFTNKPDKLQQAKDEIKELEMKVQQGERDFEQISKTIRKEVSRFEKERVKDFKTIIIKYLESLVQTQQQLIKYWDAFLPEAKAIS